jgi:1,4-alpha-glucan branching enzyme
VNNEEKILAFHRWDKGGPNDSVVVIFNFANKAHTYYNLGFPFPGLWKARFNSDWDGFDEKFSNHDSFDIVAEEGEKDGYLNNGSISIGPYSFVVYSLAGENEINPMEFKLD